MTKPVLYGFDGSTYVRTVRIVLAEKGVDYDQVPVNVLEGETRQPDHMARHPFGKVPVLDIDNKRIRETDAICRYLEDTRGEGCIPGSAPQRARMNEAMSLISAYGYDALLGVAGYHLFPDLIGGKDEEARLKALQDSETLLKLLMEIKGDDPWLAGDAPTLADYYLGPIIFYISLTDDSERVMNVPGLGDWWARMQAHEAFRNSAPDLG